MQTFTVTFVHVTLQSITSWGCCFGAQSVTGSFHHGAETPYWGSLLPSDNPAPPPKVPPHLATTCQEAANLCYNRKSDAADICIAITNLLLLLLTVNINFYNATVFFQDILFVYHVLFTFVLHSQ